MGDSGAEGSVGDAGARSSLAPERAPEEATRACPVKARRSDLVCEFASQYTVNC